MQNTLALHQKEENSPSMPPVDYYPVGQCMNL